MGTMSLGQIEAEAVKDRQVDATVEQVASAGKTIFGVEVDNRSNTSASFLKMWDTASPTLGTTEPQFIFRIPAGRKSAFPLPADGVGVAFATGVWWACVTTGGSGGTTSPTNAVLATVLTN